MICRDLILRAAVAIVMTGGAAGALHAADPNTEFYRGKTVSYIVATSPGGGHDFYGRLAARHMERFLPGSTFVIRNVPGAGHLLGANTIYGARPDGLTIGTFTTGLTISQIVGKEGVRYDLTKMSWVGKGATDTRVLLMTEKSGYKTFDDVRNAKQEIKMAASGVGGGDYNETVIIRSAFSLPMRTLFGYSGGERSLAMMRGEVEGTVGGYSSIEEVGAIAQGRIVLAFGEDIPGATNARSVATTEMQRKVVDLIEGQGVIYRLCAGPPDIPADRLAALRQAYMSAYNSPELQKEAGKRPVKPLGGEQVATMVKAVIDQPPDIVALLKGLTWSD